MAKQFDMNALIAALEDPAQVDKFASQLAEQFAPPTEQEVQQFLSQQGQQGQQGAPQQPGVPQQGAPAGPAPGVPLQPTQNAAGPLQDPNILAALFRGTPRTGG